MITAPLLIEAMYWLDKAHAIEWRMNIPGYATDVTGHLAEAARCRSKSRELAAQHWAGTKIRRAAA